MDNECVGTTNNSHVLESEIAMQNTTLEKSFILNSYSKNHTHWTGATLQENDRIEENRVLNIVHDSHRIVC